MKDGQEGTPPKRRLLKNIPAWFRMANYQRAAGLDALGWYTQIGVRQVCSAQLQNVPERILPEGDFALRAALSSLRDNPLCDPFSQPFRHRAFRWCFDFAGIRVLSVRSMTLKDLFRVERTIRPTLTRAQIDCAEQLVSDQSSFGTTRFFLGSPGWMDASVENECVRDGFVPLMLDLNFSNQP